jgi:Ni/Fe-hydrogenase 1 B-type cytochrome subunit
MAIIEPVRTDIDHPGRVKKNSASLRLWHWANTIVISGSLITVLINSTITNTRQAATVIQTEIQKSGVSLTAEQARSAAHALNDNVWDIHTYFGYCLAGLLLFRLLLEFFQLADQKFIRRLKSAYTQFKVIKKNRQAATHELAVKIIYAAFYIVLIIQVITGLFLAFEDAMAPFKSIRRSVKSVHNFCMYLFLAFIVVHLVGVFLAERKNSRGIVSDMINGGTDNL